MRLHQKSTLSIGMQALAILLITGMSIFISSCSSTGLSTITKQSYHIEDRSWEQDTLQGFVLLPNSRVLVRSKFNDDSIFVEIRTRDSLSMRSMLTNGLSVWFDPDAKENEKYSINIPAARAEMMRRQEEFLQRMHEGGDTLRRFRFDYAAWAQFADNTRKVITDTRGTYFDEANQARIFYSPVGGLVYNISFGFSQAGIEREKAQKFSVGVISERHQAQLQGASQSQMGGPRDMYGRQRQQPSSRQQRPERLGLIPVKGWIVFTLPDDKPEL